MSNHKRFELVSLLQTITGSSYYSIENLLECYANCFPNDQKGIDLLKFIVFSDGPIEDSSVDEVIDYFNVHSQKH